MTPREVLIAAKALIDTPEKWYRGVPSKGGQAKCCTALAITRQAQVPYSIREAAVYAIATVLGTSKNNEDMFDAIYAWNDASERTHAEVMDAFTRAIELAADAETVANLNRDLAAVVP